MCIRCWSCLLSSLTGRSKGRAVSWRFCRLVIYQAWGLRSLSVNGPPLSFTLGFRGKCVGFGLHSSASVGRLSFSVVGLLGRPVSDSGSGAFASCAVWLGCFYRCWVRRARRKPRIQCLLKVRRIVWLFCPCIF